MTIFSQPEYINIPRGSRLRVVMTSKSGEDFVILDVRSPEFQIEDDGTESAVPTLREHIVSISFWPMGIGMDQIVERVRRIEPADVNAFTCRICGQHYMQGCMVSTLDVTTGQIAFGCGNCAERLYAAWKAKVESENP